MTALTIAERSSYNRLRRPICDSCLPCLVPMPSRSIDLDQPVAYRCVCGEVVQIDPTDGGECDRCGRSYTGDVVSAINSETIVFDGAVPEDLPPSIEPGDDPLLGTRLHHFQIINRIGQGGMGAVYRALDESLQRYVALKVIRTPPQQDEQPDASPHVERLLQEARAQARVKHPNVVHIYYVSGDTDPPFLAMELINGETLADRLSRGPLGFRETVDIAIEIVQALRQAALQDIVHRDIKPSNILLENGQTVRLSDFGLAERVSSGALTSKSIAGTPNYLSPEACQAQPTDHRSDMYAVGVMLFEMTFGRLPHTVTTGKINDRIRAHREAPVEFPEPWPQELPERWHEILQRLLAKDPDDRYSDYRQLLIDLESVRPVDLPPAGAAVRGLGYAVDLLLVAAVQALMFAPFEILSDWLNDAILPGMLAAGLSVVAPFLAMGVQGRWKTSPGKMLMQTRIVDEHGLTPSQAVLSARTVAQFLPIWAGAIFHIFESIGLGALGWIVWPTAYVGWGLDMLVGFIRIDRRTLHDLFFGTRVVLDTAGRRAE
ncbi:MAG: protein kinase [Planctomycetaceae bacterium]|nr:protein kinase [Planctomycetaceae bacterium]